MIAKMLKEQVLEFIINRYLYRLAMEIRTMPMVIHSIFGFEPGVQYPF